MSVYDTLRRLVVEGEIPADRRLSEAEISARLQVSRTPVREALSRLEGDGLVDAKGRGVRVRTLEFPELAALLEARTALEGWAAGRVAERVAAGEVAPARLRALDDLADATDVATRSGDLAAATLANRAFHESLAALAGNAVVEQTLATWWDRIVVATRVGLHESARIDAVDAEHRAMLSAIRAGDVDAARRATAAHAERTTAVTTGGAR